MVITVKQAQKPGKNSSGKVETEKHKIGLVKIIAAEFCELPHADSIITKILWQKMLSFTTTHKKLFGKFFMPDFCIKHSSEF